MNKKVQQKRNQIKNRMGRLTDKDFFLSQSYHGRLLGQKNDITLFMDYEESDDARIAFTNGRLLYLNTANPITNLMTSRVSKIKSHEGFIAHACGHLRCSDFKRRPVCKRILQMACVSKASTGAAGIRKKSLGGDERILKCP